MAEFESIYDVELVGRRNDAKALLQPIGEGDAHGMHVGARVTKNGTVMNLGGQCVGKVIRADGATVPLTGSIIQNLAYVTLDQQSCAVPGPIQVAVMWVSGTNVTTLVIAYGTVVNTTSGNVIQPSTPIPDLTQLLAEIEAMRQATAAANAAAEKSVRYDITQTLDATQQARARGNISAPSAADLAALADGKAVRYDTAQTLVPSQMRQGRDNLNAADALEANIAGSNFMGNDLFMRGSLDQGTVTDVQYRIVLRKIARLTFPVTVVARTGFRVYVATYYETGNYRANSGWQTSYTIPKDTNFRITIARDPDDTTETATINTFTGNVIVYHGEVRYDSTQALSEASQAQARTNIGAAAAAKLAAEASAREAADNDLKSAINLNVEFNTDTDLEPGAFNVYGLNSGQDGTYKEYRSKYIDLHNAYSVTIGINFDEAHPIAGYCCAYDASKTAIPINGALCRIQLFGRGKDLTTGSGTFVLPTNTVYIRFFVRTFDAEYTLSIDGIIKPEKFIGDLQNMRNEIDAEIAVTNNNVSGIQNYIDYIYPDLELIDYNDLTPGYLNGQGGIYNPSVVSQEKTSQVIGINPEHTYKFVCDVPSATGASWLAVGFWDANDTWLGRHSAIVTTVDDVSHAELVFVPKDYSEYANAAYMRVSWRTYGAYMAVVNDITFDGKTLLNIINAEQTGQSKTYKVDGGHIDVSKSGFDVAQLGFAPLEESGKYTQGMAISNGVIFQGYGNSIIDLIDLASGTPINSFNASGGHCGSLSFANVYPDGNTDFPYLYVASYNENKTFVYNVTRTECTLEKTYIIPENVAGYCQETCIDKVTGYLWCVGHLENSYTSGEGLIVSAWDLSQSTGDNNILTPTEILHYNLPWTPYLQAVQVLNGQLFAVFGADGQSAGMLTHILVIDLGRNVPKADITDFPSAILSAEPEGIDFVFNNTSWKYDAILATRRLAHYYKLSF